MGHHIIVCPADPDLLTRLQGRAVVVSVPSLDALDPALTHATRAEVLLHCVRVQSLHPLGYVTFKEGWKDVPIALTVPSLGRVRDVVRLMPLMRRMNIRIALPLDGSDNLTALRILASWGVACIAAPGSGHVDWNRFSDLATYALLGLAPSGPIEPFAYLAQHYTPLQRIDFRGVWFDDPTRFVHMDRDGRFACSAAELESGRLVGMTPDELDGLDGSDVYRDRLESWRLAFLEKDGCASCPGWRICLGAFAATSRAEPGCRAAMADLMDVIERRQASTRDRHRELWPA